MLRYIDKPSLTNRPDKPVRARKVPLSMNREGDHKGGVKMDFWKYKLTKGKVHIVYSIDGEEMGKYTAIQYMIDNHKMNDKEACKYINNLPHL